MGSNATNSTSEVKNLGVTSPISTLGPRPDELEKTKDLEKVLIRYNLFETDDELNHRWDLYPLSQYSHEIMCITEYLPFGVIVFLALEILFYETYNICITFGEHSLLDIYLRMCYSKAKVCLSCDKYS